MPQSGPDLVGGGYLLTNPVTSLLGGFANAAQANLSARSNLSWFGLGNPTDGVLGTSGVATTVAVPVDVGTPITKVSILVGATAASAPTHQFAALYAGTGSAPALIAQTTDATSAAINASASYGWSFGTPQVITPTQAPQGFIYAMVVIAATTMPTAAVVSTPTAIGYQWTTNAPLFLSSTQGSGITTAAPTTINTYTAKAVTPIVILS